MHWILFMNPEVKRTKTSVLIYSLTPPQDFAFKLEYLSIHMV